MLSILIPVYNFDVRPLVGKLKAQADLLQVKYEILLFDDGSLDGFKILNKELGELENVVYQEMLENLGRAKIRNRLGEAAAYDYLLFMDCDSGLVNKDFLKNYLMTMQPDRLVYGGRIYDPVPPDDKDLFFHWYYGTQRESIPVNRRKEAPYESFMTNNFLIPRKIFLDIRFDVNLVQYGHEDTLFGIELKKRKIPITHIDNSLQHLGLETISVFLQKTRIAIQNLCYLYVSYGFRETKLLRSYRAARAIGLLWILKGAFYSSHKVLEKQFHKRPPSLRLFDFYKLGYLATQMKRRKRRNLVKNLLKA